MKLTNHISLVASGNNGLSLTHPLDCNVYYVDAGDGGVLIDTGAGVDNQAILREIQKDGYRVEDIRYVVITHAHGDHGAAADFFRDAAKAKLVTSAYEAGVLADKAGMESTMAQYIAMGLYPADYRFPSVEVDVKLEEGDCLKLGSVCLQAVIAPGHTGGGLCLYGEIDGKNVLFPGDTVFFDGKINLMSIFDGDLLAYRDTLYKLEQLPVEMLLPGHMQPIMNRGIEHIQKAAAAFHRFSVPPSIC